MSAGLEIQLIAILVAGACSILGVFLVLKSMAMVSDAITHTILLGIVLAFFIGAGIVGVLTVYLVELLNSTRLLKEDSAIGIVFPLLFSMAVILISKYTKNVHLDVDSVLLGELAFAPFNRIEIFGFSVAKSLVSIFIIFIVNFLFITIFFKELKISTFDKALAVTLELYPYVPCFCNSSNFLWGSRINTGSGFHDRPSNNSIFAYKQAEGNDSLKFTYWGSCVSYWIQYGNFI